MAGEHNNDHPKGTTNGGEARTSSSSQSSSSFPTRASWTNEALHFQRGTAKLDEFRNAWERTIQEAKSKFIVGDANNNGTGAPRDDGSTNTTNSRRHRGGIMSNTTANQNNVWGGLQTAFGSSFDAAASGDRAISMESIRELAKRTVQKPINDGLLKVGDSQFMEKFRQRAAASASHGTDASAAFTGGLRRSASKPDDLNTDANKTTGAPSSSRRMRRSESKSGEDENTQSLSRGSSPFSSSQDLSAIIEKNVMPKVKDITENITKNLQRPPEGWDVFKAVSSKPKSGGSIPTAASPPRTTFKHGADNNSSKNKFFSGLSSRRSSQDSLRSLSDNETDAHANGGDQHETGEIDAELLREKFGKVTLQNTRRLLRKASSEALDTLKSKFTNSGGGVGETNNEMIETLSTSPKSSEGEKEQFSIVGGGSSGKKSDISTQTATSPRRPRSIKEPGRKVAIVTTATLPWMTGTAVNPLLRAAYLARRGLHEVTLVVPFIPVEEQKTLHPNNVFESPEQQEQFVRNWVKERCGFDVPNLKLNFYPGRYATDKMSIIPVGDVSSHIKNSNDVAVLEEPEHLNWFHSGPRWSDTFEHVVGIIHTNYLDYVRLENHGRVKERALGFVNSVVSRVHCHKVIKLSDAVQDFPRSCTMNVHGVSPIFLDVGASKAAAKRVQLMHKGNDEERGLSNNEPQFASITSTTKASSSSSSSSSSGKHRKERIITRTRTRTRRTKTNDPSLPRRLFPRQVVWGKVAPNSSIASKAQRKLGIRQTCPIPWAHVTAKTWSVRKPRWIKNYL